MFYISRIKISNIRCFPRDFDIDFEKGNEIQIWNSILGDNATGKTTFLKCIALGLSDESSAAGLLRESEQGFVRRDEPEAEINITLKDDSTNEIGEITTKIIKIKNEITIFENLRQTTSPPDFVPWDRIFLSAYGIGRGIASTGDIAGYSAISAVYNLFNYSEGLQNPELVFRRLLDNKDKKKLSNILENILNLPKGRKITIDKDGIRIDGYGWKKIPLRDIADGYKSTLQWITDFLGWAVSFNYELSDIKKIKGIVLVDSLEEHLHPKWQRTVVKSLHSIFPKVQFIVTTHSPLIASGTTDVTNSQIIEFNLDVKNRVSSKIIPKEGIYGKQVDEILLSPGFNLFATGSPKYIDDLLHYLKLKAKDKLTSNERKELERLKKWVRTEYRFGDSNFEKEVETAVLEVLRKMIKREPEEIHKLVAKKKLKEIFYSEEN